MALQHNDLIDLSIEKPAAGGRMIARHEGQIVLVRGAIPGERVRARIERSSRSVAYATVEEVIERHPSRRLVRGDWTCGGQAYAFVDYPQQLEIKRDVIRDAFARLAKMPLGDRQIPVTGSREDGYRMRARLHVAAGRIGFLREGTHELCEAAQTGQLLPETSRAIDQVSQRLRTIDPDGVLALELSENIAGSERALHLQLRPGPKVRTTAFAAIAGVPGLTGVTCQLATGAAVVRLGGVPLVGDTLAQILGAAAAVRFGDLRLERQPRAFFQANRYLLPALVNAVLSRVLPDGDVIDLYAGVGLFAAALAAAGRDRITAVEGDRISGADLAMNARRLGDAVSCELQAVERYLAARGGAPAKTIIVDPPRTGVSRQALEAILAHGAARLVYVSCDIATLARDVRRAVDARYRLTSLEAFDLFPNTAHIETLCVLDQ